VDTGELARAAAGRLAPEQARVEGEDGVSVSTDPPAAEVALFGFANCALRHGGLETVALRVTGAEVAIGPVKPAVVPIILGEDLRDLGAAVGVRVVNALRGSAEVDGERLRVRFSASA
jgi:hypothetical protein